MVEEGAEKCENQREAGHEAQAEGLEGLGELSSRGGPPERRVRGWCAPGERAGPVLLPGCGRISPEAVFVPVPLWLKAPHQAREASAQLRPGLGRLSLLFRFSAVWRGCC